MGLESIVNVNIILESAGISQPGFGTTLFLASLSSRVQAVWGTDVVRTYSSAAAMLDAAEGFVAADRAYKAAVKYFSQDPKPEIIKIGKRALPQTQVIKITPTNTTAGFVYGGKINGVAWSYTVQAAPNNTVAATVPGIVSAIEALASGPTAAAVGGTPTHLTCTGAEGECWDFTDMSRGLTIEDVTIDPGIATDLAAIKAADNDWYMLGIDSHGDAEIKAAAAWVEAEKKLFACQSADTSVITSSSTDTLSDLKGLGYFRTVPMWGPDISADMAMDMLGSRSTAIPGSDTWNGKTLAGMSVANWLTDTQRGYITAKNGTYYVTVGNVGRTQGGHVAGGEWADTTRFLDWVRATIQANCINAMYALPKLPNTSEGRAVIKSQILQTLDQGVRNGGFANDPEPAVTMPPVSQASSFDSITRTLSGISWTAKLANAIHIINPITGYVTQ